MRALILLVFLSVTLTSCSMFHVHKVEIEQGNIMTPGQVNRLHTGMSEGQVKQIMGEPVLVNILNDHEENYVYTFQVGGTSRTEKRVTLTFSHGYVTHIQREGI